MRIRLFLFTIVLFVATGCPKDEPAEKGAAPASVEMPDPSESEGEPSGEAAEEVPPAIVEPPPAPPDIPDPNAEPGARTETLSD